MKIVLNERGSGRGLSYWKQYLQDPCMRRLRLSAEAAEAGEESESSDALARGTCFHKLAELYHAGKLMPEDVATGLDFIRPDGSPAPLTAKAISEAISLFTFWVAGMPPNGLGRIVAVEAKFPKTEAGRAAIKAALPFLDDDFTGAADLITEIRSTSEAADIAELFTQFGAPLPMDLDPGVWLWDFKTLTDLSMSYKFESGYQEINYPWMLRLDNAAIGPHIRGFVYIGIATGRKRVIEPSIDVIIHPFPTQEKIDAMLRRLNAAKRVRDALLVDDDLPNREACAPKFPNGKWCPFLDNGQCNGY